MLGVGLFFARPSETRPTPTTLVYAYEHGTGAAYWATDPEHGESGSVSAAWVGSRVNAAFDETRDLSAFGYVPTYRLGISGDGSDTPVARAEVVNAPPPAIGIIEDSIVGEERRVSLGVRSRIGAEMLGFQLEGGTRLLAINGTALEDPEATERADHWGEPEGYVQLDLRMPADEAIGLHVIEHLLRPEELLGSAPFERPADLAPNVNRLSDRAMFRYSVGVFVDPRHAIMPTITDLTELVGDLTGEPTTGIAVSDSAAVSDTTVVPDTTAVSDTTAVPDTAAVPDTTAVEDTTAAPDSTVRPDTLLSAGRR